MRFEFPMTSPFTPIFGALLGIVVAGIPLALLPSLRTRIRKSIKASAGVALIAGTVAAVAWHKPYAESATETITARLRMEYYVTAALGNGYFSEGELQAAANDIFWCKVIKVIPTGACGRVGKFEDLFMHWVPTDWAYLLVPSYVPTNLGSTIVVALVHWGGRRRKKQAGPPATVPGD